MGLSRRRVIRERIAKQGWSLDDACNRPHRTKKKWIRQVSVAELARKHDINYGTLYWRLQQGMSVIDAVSEPNKRLGLTKKEILDAKSLGLTKDKTAEFVLGCTRNTLSRKLKEYGIQWRRNPKQPVTVTINGVTYPHIRAAILANGISNTACFYYWRKKRTGTNQELLQQYIDFRAEKKTLKAA